MNFSPELVISQATKIWGDSSHQQIRGSCSPTSISMPLLLPKAVAITTLEWDLVSTVYPITRACSSPDASHINLIEPKIIIAHRTPHGDVGTEVNGRDRGLKLNCQVGSIAV